MEHPLAPDDLLRFRREGELTAQLDHPGIVRVHGAGVDGERPYLVYELVAGARTLEDVLDQGDVAARVERVLAVAEALAHAHERSVIHRDVKPANILVDPEGRIRLADFGLATAEGQERLTETGTILGTPTHMAPEQVQGERSKFGPATDVWALGVLLYRALCGEPPFPATTFVGLAHQIVSAPITPPGRLAVGVPPALEALCLRALERDPERRPRDAGAFAEELALALTAPAAPSKAWVWMVVPLVLIPLGVMFALPDAPTAPPPTPPNRPTGVARATPTPVASPTRRTRPSTKPIRTFVLGGQGPVEFLRLRFMLPEPNIQTRLVPELRVVFASRRGLEVHQLVDGMWSKEFEDLTPLIDVAVSRDGKTLATLHDGGKVRLRAGRGLGGFRSLEVRPQSLRIALSPNGATLAAGGHNRSVRLYATSPTGRDVHVKIPKVTKPGQSVVWGLGFINGEHLVAACGRPMSSDRRKRLGVVNELVFLNRLQPHTTNRVQLLDRPEALAVSPHWIVIGGRQGSLQAWRGSAGAGWQEEARLENQTTTERVAHHGRVGGLVFLGRNGLLSLGGSDSQPNDVARWRLRQSDAQSIPAERRFLLHARGRRIRGLALDPTETYLLIGELPSRDGKRTQARVELWRLADALRRDER